MARNVTEQELDALLAPATGSARTESSRAGAATASAARPEVEARDFRQARWLSPDDLDSFRMRGNAAGAAVVEALLAVLPRELSQGEVEVSEDSLDAALRGTARVALVVDGPAGPSLAAIDRSAALFLAELALGAADSTASDKGLPDRGLTPLESQIVERLLAQAFARVALALGITAKEQRFVAEPTELARALAADGTVGASTDRRRVAVRIAITVGEHKLVLHFLLAGAVPPPRKSAAGAPQRQAIKPALPAEIGTTRVEVSAVLCETKIMLTDLLALEAGDLIPLSATPGDPIELRIEGEPCGRARFGARDGRLAVRLTEILRHSPNR